MMFWNWQHCDLDSLQERSRNSQEDFVVTVSTLESEVTASTEFDTVSDEIRVWSRCQHCVSDEDGVLNEFRWCGNYVSYSPSILLFSIRLCVTWQMRTMWNKFSHGRDNFQKLILTQTPSLTWFRQLSTSFGTMFLCDLLPFKSFFLWSKLLGYAT